MKWIVVLSLLAVTGLAGCGRSNSIYEDKQPAVTTDGLSTLPKGFYNTSVNSAIADVTKVKTKSVLRLKTWKGASDAGAFNDPNAKGNLALVSITLFDEEKVSDFSDLSFEAKQVKGTRPLDLYLQVDLKCDFTTPYVLHAMSVDMSSSAKTDGYRKYSISSADDVWTSHGVPVMDAGSVNEIIPETDSGNGLGNLDDLIAEYPDACVRNTQSYDQGFPYALPTGAVMFGLGDKDEVDLNEVTVRKISIGSEVFSDWEQ